MTLALRYAARSDRGLVREANEDSVYAGPRLLAVADGMGGMAAGEVASNIVIASLAPLDEDAPGADLIEVLHEAVEEANLHLREAVESNPSLDGMGTTLTTLLFEGNRMALMHVGDSRAYIWRDGEITQITHDDTYVQMLVDEGRLTSDEAHTHPQRSLLTRALDGREVAPDTSIRSVRVGDRYLLCSDGLSGVVSKETLAETMELSDPTDCVNRLIELALRGGGPDNITCIVADVVDNDEVSSSVPIVAGAAAHDRGKTSSAASDSAAGRAALAQDDPDERADPFDPEAPPTPQPRPRSKRFFLLALAGTTLCLVVLGFLGWKYIQQQYYIGVGDSGKVAIYRGVDGSIGGLKFQTLEHTANFTLDDLPPVMREKVRDNIWASSLEDAKDRLDKLRKSKLPMCPQSTPRAPDDETSTESSPTVTHTPGVTCRTKGAP